MSGRRGPQAAPMPIWFQPLADGYFRALIRRGRQQTTVRGYLVPLRNFSRWLDANGVESLEQVTRAHVERWQDSHVDRWTIAYQAVAVAAIKGLLKWCAREELSMSSQMLYLQIDSPRLPPPAPRPIPLADLRVIQQALADPDSGNLVQLRTRALFWSLFSSGSRITAMLSLDRDSIRDRQAVIVQKGGGRHTLLFSEQAVSAIDDYLAARTDSQPALFLGHPPSFGSFQMGKRFGRVVADHAWYRLADDLGIGRFSSHRIRHSTATEMLRAGIDSLVISRHLGHRSPAMIATYAQVQLEQRQRAVLSIGA